MLKRPKKYRFWFKLLAISLLVLVLLEVFLRLIFGFGEIPVYYKSSDYEYALAANQDINRFGNSYYINASGMRSAELGEGEFRILKFGDSILNGGIATDQDELASSVLEARMNIPERPEHLRILNVSAGSWGPDNAFTWMQEHGDFDAKIIVLLFSSHDWQDQMSFQDVVGRISFYPEHQPYTAISDAIRWIFSRYVEHINWNALPKTKRISGETHPYNPGWEAFITYTNENDIPFLVYHHATAEEVLSGKWDEKGKALENFLSEQGAQVVSGLDANFTADDFRDALHPNTSGQQKIADALEPVLNELLQDALR